MKDLRDFIDFEGFVGQLKYGQIEAGDALHKTSTLYFFEAVKLWLNQETQKLEDLKDRYLQLLQKVYLPNGEPTRHWNRNCWPGQSGTCSWDQLRPVICVLVFFIAKTTQNV